MNPVVKKAVAAALLVAGAVGAYLVRSGRLTRHGRSKVVHNGSSGASNGSIRITETAPFPSLT